MYAQPLTPPEIYPVNSRQLLAAENSMPLVRYGYAAGFGIGAGTGVQGLGGLGCAGDCNCGGKCSGSGMGDAVTDIAPYTSLAVHLGMVVFAVVGFKLLFGGRRSEARAQARRRPRKRYRGN